MLGALFGFRGRLSRPGYWEVAASIVLIDVLIVLGRMYVADSGLPGGLPPSSAPAAALLKAAPWALTILTIWGFLAAGVKRLHDRGRPGALLLLALIPVIGWLWLLIDLFALEGDERRNRYGAPPHAHPNQAAGRRGVEWGARPVFPPHMAYYGEADAHAGRPPQMAALPPHVDPPEPEAPAPDVEPELLPAAQAESAPPEPPVLAADAPPPSGPEPAAQPEPEVLQATDVPAEAGEAAPEPQPAPALQVMPEPRPAELQPRAHDRSESRPLMLDHV